MRVSSSSRPAAHLLYPPVIQDHRTLRPRREGRREEWKTGNDREKERELDESYSGGGLMQMERDDSQRETNREVKRERQKKRQMNPEAETEETG